MREVLTPVVWRPGDRAYSDATVGSVDFDNDEGGTEASIQIISNEDQSTDAPRYVVLIGGDPGKFAIRFCD